MKTLNVLKSIAVIVCCLVLHTTMAQNEKETKDKLPATYDFDYLYKLKMTHKKGNMTFDYYLNKDSKYFGFDTSEMAKGNNGTKVFMVMDSELGLTAMFMDMMGKKVVQKTSFNTSKYGTDTDNMSDHTFTQIDSKTINGYECEGYVSENDDQKITFYITDDVDVSFNQMFGSNTKNLPKGFDTGWLEKYAENGLMMEMIYEDKKKSKNNMTMLCTDLEKTDFSIDTSKYGSMMGAFGG